MPRKDSVAVPEGNGPIPPNKYVLPGITAEDLTDEYGDKVGRKFVRKMDSKSQKNPRR